MKKIESQLQLKREETTDFPRKVCEVCVTQYSAKYLHIIHQGSKYIYLLPNSSEAAQTQTRTMNFAVGSKTESHIDVEHF